MLRFYVTSYGACRDARRALGDAAGVLAKRLAANEAGATAVEYGLIGAGIAVALIIVVFALGGDLQNLFTSSQNAIASPEK